MTGMIREILAGFFRRGAEPGAWEEREPEPARVWRTFGLKVAWHSQTRIKWKKCPYCTGGMQMLRWEQDRNEWGPIPYEFRKEMDDETGSPSGNIRSCPRCWGKGHNWFPVEDG